jgi:uncharacterized membrane protein YeiH
MFHLLDIIGTVAFALSGALTAMSKSLIFWRIYYCLVTVGGGTLRDVMIGKLLWDGCLI